MSETKPTPTPYAVFIHRDASGLVIGPPYTEGVLQGNVKTVATCSGNGELSVQKSQAFANMRFLARAANAHELMADAIELVRRRHQSKAKKVNFDDCGCDDCVTLENALATARQDPQVFFEPYEWLVEQGSSK